jgi:hypothetical protein
MDWRQDVERLVAQMRDQLRALGTTGPQTPQARAAIDALAQATTLAGDDQLRRREVRLANSLSDDQLQASLAFFTSPAGKAWVAQNNGIEQDERASAANLGADVVSAARRRLCAEIACLEASAN